MREYRTRWRALFALLTLLLSLATAPALPARANTDPVYFPQTGHFIRGTFRLFWEQYGGLGNFGYPTTDEFYRNSDGRIVQYFERARFELFETNSQGTIYIILGNVGRDYVQARGYNFPPIGPIPDTSTQRYFPETQHSIQGDFKINWDAIDGPTFMGAPISEQVAEVIDNQQKAVQYFERGRLERNSDGSFSRGLIARDLAPCQQRAARPSNLPPGGPVPEGDSRTCNSNSPTALASVSPTAALPGTRFTLQAINFSRNEEVALWINLPDRSVRKIRDLATADGNGQLVLTFDTRPDDQLGFYTIVASGIRSRREVVASFQIVR